MEGVVIVAPWGSEIGRFADLLQAENWQVDLRSEDELVVESGKRHAYLIRDDHLMQEYGADEVTKVLSHVSNPIFFALEFNDFNFGKEVLEKIGDAPDLVVDNDHGDILRGTDFIRRMQENKDWDWRQAKPRT